MNTLSLPELQVIETSLRAIQIGESQTIRGLSVRRSSEYVYVTEGRSMTLSVAIEYVERYSN